MIHLEFQQPMTGTEGLKYQASDADGIKGV